MPPFCRRAGSGLAESELTELQCWVLSHIDMNSRCISYGFLLSSALQPLPQNPPPWQRVEENYTLEPEKENFWSWHQIRAKQPKNATKNTIKRVSPNSPRKLSRKKNSWPSTDPCVPAQLASALRPMTTVFATTKAPPVAIVFVVSLILLSHSCVKLHFTTCHTFMFIECQVIVSMQVYSSPSKSERKTENT